MPAGTPHLIWRGLDHPQILMSCVCEPEVRILDIIKFGYQSILILEHIRSFKRRSSRTRQAFSLKIFLKSIHESFNYQTLYIMFDALCIYVCTAVSLVC